MAQWPRTECVAWLCGEILLCRACALILYLVELRLLYAYVFYRGRLRKRQLRLKQLCGDIMLGFLGVVAGEGRSRDVARAWSALERNLLTVSNAY